MLKYWIADSLQWALPKQLVIWKFLKSACWTVVLSWRSTKIKNDMLSSVLHYSSSVWACSPSTQVCYKLKNGVFVSLSAYLLIVLLLARNTWGTHLGLYYLDEPHRDFPHWSWCCGWTKHCGFCYDWRYTSAATIGEPWKNTFLLYTGSGGYMVCPQPHSQIAGSEWADLGLCFY